MAAVNSIDDAAGKIDVVVLEQNHIEESDAVVTATTNLHGLLLQHAQAWCGLAGVQHTGLGTLQQLHILVGHGGNTTHTLHDIQHQSLGLEQRTNLTRYHHGDVALFNMCAVRHQHLDLHIGVETMEHFLGNLYTCQNTVLLDEQV